MTISSIPILDLSLYEVDNPTSPSSVQFLKSLYDAMANVGFFYISNHGIPLELQQDSFGTLKKFFKLPLEEKTEIDFNKSPHFRGYSKLHSEITDYKQDNREQIDLGREEEASPIEGNPSHIHLRGPNQWPSQVPEFRETITDLMDSMTRVGLVLLRAMATVLEFDAEEFMSLFGKDYGVRMKLLRYPALNDPIDKPLDHGLGVGPHKDRGFLTILLQDDIGGLQVQTQEGEWVDAKPIPNTFIVNIGEMLERLTKQVFVATTHRVVNKPSANYTDRYSIPLFISPALETKIPQIELRKTKKKTVISDVRPDQLLQNETYGVNELLGYIRSHQSAAQLWYYFDEEKDEWFRRPIQA